MLCEEQKARSPELIYQPEALVYAWQRKGSASHAEKQGIGGRYAIPINNQSSESRFSLFEFSNFHLD